MPRIIPILIIAFLLQACAKQGMPSGGPKDTAPPKVLAVTPENKTTNFNATGFSISFDEYVVLKDAENNILVSPPLKTKPEYRTKGKSIVVRLADSMQSNTTYIFQFNNAIADFNEGNLIESYSYVLSTGSFIDSMSISGKVRDAQLQKPREETISVWLFTKEQHATLLQSLNDTSAKPPTPSYATRCNKDGSFAFNYIRPGNYHIVALVDDDKNMQIGLSESVAFIDSTVIAVPMKKADSTSADSSLATRPIDTSQVTTTVLNIFTPATERQRLTGSNFTAAGKVRITSLQPLEKPQIVSPNEEIFWHINDNRDTITLWTLREKCDSLSLMVSDPTGINDTLRLRWRPKKGKTGPSLESMQIDKTGMKLSTTKLHYFDTLALLFSNPINPSRCLSDSTVSVLRLKDSSLFKCNTVCDSGQMKIIIAGHFQQGENYTLRIPAGTFHDIYGNANDSLSAIINVSKAEEYGNLNLTVDNSSNDAIIVELLDENNKVSQRKTLTGNGKLEFPHLKPAKYRIRATIDSNNNGKWDTGNFGKQQQPERVVFHPQTLDIRANWDFNETLTIK